MKKYGVMKLFDFGVVEKLRQRIVMQSCLRTSPISSQAEASALPLCRIAKDQKSLASSFWMRISGQCGGMRHNEGGACS